MELKIDFQGVVSTFAYVQAMFDPAQFVRMLPYEFLGVWHL
jgi:hypothetical protein